MKWNEDTNILNSNLLSKEGLPVGSQKLAIWKGFENFGCEVGFWILNRNWCGMETRWTLCKAWGSSVAQTWWIRIYLISVNKN